MTSTAHAITQPAPLPESLHVLLVDDDAVNRILASALVQQVTGVEPDTAADGEEALAMAQQQAYDLILMDLLLPGMQGTEAAQRIRALPGAHGRAPIVALSASAHADEVARSLGAGMNEHLCKPLCATDLAQVLHRWVASTAAPAAATDRVSD